MRKKISVIGKGVKLARELSRLADVDEDVRGADVVVLAGDADLDTVARSAPAATIVLVGDGLEDRCRAAYDRLLFPRARIIGVPYADRVGDAIESIVLESDEAHDVVAMKDGEFTACSALLGRGGIRELV